MESAQAKILYNEQVAPGYSRRGLGGKTPPIVPGHFVMLRVEHGLDALLTRPFGIYKELGAKGKPPSPLRGTGVEILYQVVGKGTDILSLKAPGEKIDILGPLGGGFPAPAEGEKTVLVAGGAGNRPLYLFAAALKEGLLLFGSRDKSVARIADEFKGFNCDIERSEEHTSELQSLAYLVCRLL